MNLHTLYLTKNNCYKSGKRHTVKGIMVHSTGANNPNLKRYVGPDDGLLGENPYGNHWNQPTPEGQQICCHAFIGKLKDGSIATYQTLPWDMVGWHCGNGKNGSANYMGYVGFEICEDGLTDAGYFNKVYQEAAELCAYLCKKYGLTEKNIICHSEGAAKGIASNHGDVMHWFPKHGKNMDTFRAEVKKLLSENNTQENTKPDTGTLYRVQCGAFSKKANAQAMAKQLEAKGYSTYLVQVDGLYKVQTGAFSVKANADKLCEKLKKDGFSAFVTTQGGKAVSGDAIQVGDRVKVKSGAKTYEGKSLASFVYQNTYDVQQLSGDRAVIGQKGVVTAAVKVKDLIPA